MHTPGRGRRQAYGDQDGQGVRVALLASCLTAVLTGRYVFSITPQASW